MHPAPRFHRYQGALRGNGPLPMAGTAGTVHLDRPRAGFGDSPIARKGTASQEVQSHEMGPPGLIADHEDGNEVDGWGWLANNGCIMKLTEISFRLLTLPLLVILVGCVTVNDSTVKHMSTAKLCEFLSPKWITLPSERKAVRSEVSSRGASCSPGSPAPVRQKARKESAGTGFIVSEVGHILTNHHVVKGCRTVVASMTNMIVPIGITVQPKLDAPKTREERSNFEDRGLRVIGVDARSDLALLKMARPSSTVAAFRGGRGVRTGEATPMSRSQSWISLRELWT